MKMFKHKAQFMLVLLTHGIFYRHSHSTYTYLNSNQWTYTQENKQGKKQFTFLTYFWRNRKFQSWYEIFSMILIHVTIILNQQ